MKRFNEDYRRGMHILIHGAKEAHINILKYPWTIHLSKKLSEEGLCEAFWQNVKEQQRFQRIELCENFSDVFHKVGGSLFSWKDTPQGFELWEGFENRLITIIGKYVSFNILFNAEEIQ